MFKVNKKNIEIGTMFCLPTRWQYKIAKMININNEELIQSFKIAKFTELGYLCIANNKFYLYVSSDIIHYLNGEHIDNEDNKSVCLSKYFPLENSKVLIKSSSKNIIPVQFKLLVDVIEGIPSMSFKFVHLLTSDSYEVSSFEDCFWKKLYGIDTYMSDMEKMYQDTFVHKDLVKCVGEKFSKYLEEQGLFEDAAALQERIIIHDNSKITNKKEFKALTSIINEKSSLGNANIQLSTMKQELIKLHWQNNSHHPEYYENYDEMSRIDRMEMVCDWMARSLQYKNDLIEFVQIRQRERFHFSDSMYEEVLNYCKIIVSLYKGNNYGNSNKP